MSVTMDAHTALDVLRREICLNRGEQRTVLRDIRWETLEQILADRGDSNNPRLFYDRGTLEITSPSETHERFKEILAHLVGDKGSCQFRSGVVPVLARTGR
jgi:hypothetical protein